MSMLWVRTRREMSRTAPIVASEPRNAAPTEAAGGEYVSFAEEGSADSSPTTVTVEMEQFYAGARDADVIIYNGTIDDGVSALAELVEKNQLLADFKAVREGSVWACDSNLYQQMTSMADIILDLRAAISGSDEPTTFFWKLA